jgi:hypothetical protein
MTENMYVGAELTFLNGNIIDQHLCAAMDFGVAMERSWSTPVCGWFTRRFSCNAGCPQGTTRDPTRCPNEP